MQKKTLRPRARPPAQTAGEPNAAQQQAVRHGRVPLLIIAGAGTGKTLTLAHRVARLIEDGVPPERILLLTFTRRAAAEMLHRVETLRGNKPARKPGQDGDATGTTSPRKVWGGTFHAVGARLLRIHGPTIGVDPRFTIHDQADSTDLLDALRTELKLAGKRHDFPKKGTCQAVDLLVPRGHRPQHPRLPQAVPRTTVVKLEENYRSTEPVLEAANAVIAQASEGYGKRLWSSRTEGERPRLVACADEYAEARHVVEQVLRHRTAGIPLKQQAVLFRASHHSLAVEMELARRKIAFHKYGGLKFAEAAHVKDLVAFLRLAENPRDVVSGLRLLKLLPGIGPKKAQGIMDGLVAAGSLDSLSGCKVPAAAAASWTGFVTLLGELTREPTQDVVSQIRRVLKFYTPLLRRAYDEPEQRLEDLRKLRDLGERFEDRASFLAELTLDPPTSTQDLAGAAARAKDFLVLSTIHSAKGLEWDAVFVINATEGGIPSSRAETTAQIDEELRLFYVALTRARTGLTVTYPRYRSGFQGRWGGGWDDLPTPDAVPACRGPTPVPGRGRVTRPSAWSGGVRRAGVCKGPSRLLLAGMALDPKGAAQGGRRAPAA